MAVFNRKTVPMNTRVHLGPTISFTKNGTITLNKVAVPMLGLKVGCRVEIEQDDDDIYRFIVREAKDGFPTWKGSGNNKGRISFSCKRLCVLVWELHGAEETLTCRIQKDGSFFIPKHNGYK